MSDRRPSDLAVMPSSDIDDKSAYHDGSVECDMLAIASEVELARLTERTRKTLQDAIPRNTRRAYEGDLRRFASWCTSAGMAAMPAVPGTVALYMRSLGDTGRGVATIERALAAISTAHVRAGHASPWLHPLVSDMRAALRRELGTRPKKKVAADDEILRRMLGVLPGSLLGLRDRALLTTGWAAALRRSELVGADVEHVRRVPKGLVLLVPESKTDQERRGEEVPVFFSNRAEHCPVRSLDEWLTAAGITTGAIFRQVGRAGRLGERLSDAAVADRVKHWAKRSGLEWRDFAGHSLRSGFVTTASRRGRDLDSIMVTTRHRSVSTVREYVQRETLHERAAGEGLL